MRAVVQRVIEASVSVDDAVVGSVGRGLVAFVGVGRDDTSADAAALAAKVAALRIFPDDAAATGRSVLDVGGSVLVVSQFTLLADVRKGRRPSFAAAAPPEVAEPLVEEVGRRLAGLGVPVAFGRFGASMIVEVVNDGPFTLILEVVDGKVR